MELKIKYHDREIDFTFDDGLKVIKGNSIKQILSAIDQKTALQTIYVEGSSVSYTFTRQVFLMVNMLSVLSSCEVFLNGKKVKAGQELRPTYL